MLLLALYLYKCNIEDPFTNNNSSSKNIVLIGDSILNNSAYVLANPKTATDANFYGIESVIGHEYFHNWNVERIRPKTLEPFNFEKSNMSNELWCAEGFTQYYGSLLLARAGFTTDKVYLNTVSSLVNTKQKTPGLSARSFLFCVLFLIQNTFTLF